MKTVLLILAALLVACAPDINDAPPGYRATGEALTGIRFVVDGSVVPGSACTAPTQPYADNPDVLALYVMGYMARFDVGVSGINAPATWFVAIHGGGSEQCVQGGLGGLSPVGLRGGVSDIWTAPGEDQAVLASVVAHELGHLIGGLGDSSDPSTVMFRSVAQDPVPAYQDRVAATTTRGEQNEYQAMLRVLGPAKVLP